MGEILSLGSGYYRVFLLRLGYQGNLHEVTRLKLAKPEMIVIVGGPEVSYEAEALLGDPEIDYCIAGEGEKAFAELFAGVRPKEGEP